MILKLVGISLMSLSLVLVSKTGLIQDNSCCLPSQASDIISFSKVEETNAAWSVSKWLRVVTHKNASVKAYANGKVREVISTGKNGMLLVLEHHNGLLSVYKHLANAHVQVGDLVKKGETIAQPQLDAEFLNNRFDFGLTHTFRIPDYLAAK